MSGSADGDVAARVKALESIMIERGIASPAAVDRLAAIYAEEVGPHLGAAVVAQRPDGTEGLDEKDLAALVTRDSLIGTGPPRRP